jgi:6-phosphofructokinase
MKKVDAGYALDAEKLEKMITTLKSRDIDLLVVIGGDGTLAATKELHKATRDRHPFEIMGFLKTIDNDIRTHSIFEGEETAVCPGFPTAAVRIAKAVADIRTVAIGGRRVFLVETMGRDAGWLAAATYFGGPNAVLLPEIIISELELMKLYRLIERDFRNNHHMVIVVSEGIYTKKGDSDVQRYTRTQFGERKLGGAVLQLCPEIERDIKLRDAQRLEGPFFGPENPIEVRPHHTDYVPRAGGPCAYDLKLVEVLAERLYILLVNRQFGTVPTLTTVVPYDQLDVQHTGVLNLEDMGPFYFPHKTYYDHERMLPNIKFGRFIMTITTGEKLE